jgi:hypothetical protein
MKVPDFRMKNDKMFLVYENILKFKHVYDVVILNIIHFEFSLTGSVQFLSDYKTPKRFLQVVPH